MGSSVVLSDIGVKIPHEDTQFNRETVADLLNRTQLGFPGAQPVSFARNHFQELQKRDYYLCEKTDGMRCLLFLSSFPDPVNGGPMEAQFLIDRKNDYYYIERDTLHLPRQEDMASFHTGTILDGELVRQKHKNGREVLTYLIFDCLCLDGINIMSRDLDKRLGKVSAFVYEPWKALARQYPEDAAAQPFQIELKKMELPYGTEMMFKDKIPNLPHGNDGLIFTCKNTPYMAGTDPNILKWKPPHENTIDFKVSIGAFPMEEDEDGAYEDWDGKPQIDLTINHGDRTGYQRYADLELTDAEWEAMKCMNQMFDGRIIECFRDPVSGGWRPKIEPDGTPRFRDDKRDANHVSTVESVRESIEDAVTEEDLIRQAGKIKEAWKRREAEARQRREEEKRKMADQEGLKRKQTEVQRARQQQQQQQQQQRPAQPPPEVDDGPHYS